MSYTSICDYRYGTGKFLCMNNDLSISKIIGQYGVFSPLEVEVFQKFIPEDGVAIDVGALFGELTIPMAECCPKGWVYAFEPQRIPFQMLCGNLQINSIRNVRAWQAAVGGGPESVVGMESRLEPDFPVYWGHTRVGNFGYDPVPVVYVDDVPAKRLDFIKIDVEGYEPQVLAGCKKSATEYHPVIYLEFQENKVKIRELLYGLGYEAHFLHYAPSNPEDTGVPMLLAVHPSCSVDWDWMEKTGFKQLP